MFIETLILSIITGLARKGSMINLSQINLIRSSLLLTAVFIQVAIDYFGRVKLGSAGFFLHLSSYLLVFYFFWLNKHTFNIFLPLGTFLNFLVIALNNGSMPVEARYLTDTAIEKLDFSVTHALMTEATLLPWLGDGIYVMWPMQQLISVGDIIMNVGIFIFIQKVMTKAEKSLAGKLSR